MKTIARTALLGLLIGATVSSMCLAGDPISMPAPAGGTPNATTARTLYADFRGVTVACDSAASHAGIAAGPADSDTSAVSRRPLRPGLADNLLRPNPLLRNQAGRSWPILPATASRRHGPPGSAPPPNQPAGNVAYDSIDGQASASDPLGMANVDPFGPMFYLNGYFGDSPGWTGPSYQADLYYPWHIVPGRSVFFGVLQAAVDDYGKGYFNAASVTANISPTRTGSWVRGDGWTGMTRRPPAGCDWAGSARVSRKIPRCPSELVRVGGPGLRHSCLQGSPAARFFRVTTSI